MVLKDKIFDQIAFWTKFRKLDEASLTYSSELNMIPNVHAPDRNSSIEPKDQFNHFEIQMGTFLFQTEYKLVDQQY